MTDLLEVLKKHVSKRSAQIALGRGYIQPPAVSRSMDADKVKSLMTRWRAEHKAKGFTLPPKKPSWAFWIKTQKSWRDFVKGGAGTGSFHHAKRAKQRRAYPTTVEGERALKDNLWRNVHFAKTRMHIPQDVSDEDLFAYALEAWMNGYTPMQGVADLLRQRQRDRQVVARAKSIQRISDDPESVSTTKFAGGLSQDAYDDELDADDLRKRAVLAQFEGTQSARRGLIEALMFRNVPKEDLKKIRRGYLTQVLRQPTSAKDLRRDVSTSIGNVRLIHQPVTSGDAAGYSFASHKPGIEGPVVIKHGTTFRPGTCSATHAAHACKDLTGLFGHEYAHKRREFEHRKTYGDDEQAQVIAAYIIAREKETSDYADQPGEIDATVHTVATQWDKITRDLGSRPRLSDVLASAGMGEFADAYASGDHESGRRRMISRLWREGMPVRESVDTSQKILVLMQGISGSGKTTEAQKLVRHCKQEGIPCVYASADVLRTSRGKYTFNAEENAKLHRKVQGLAASAMRHGVSFVIVDNTNIKRKDVKPYLDLAEKYDYDVHVNRIDTDIETAKKRNAARPEDRRIPDEVIDKQAREMENLVTESKVDPVNPIEPTGGRKPRFEPGRKPPHAQDPDLFTNLFHGQFPKKRPPQLDAETALRPRSLGISKAEKSTAQELRRAIGRRLLGGVK